jgi:hypothetical protein
MTDNGVFNGAAPYDYRFHPELREQSDCRTTMVEPDCRHSSLKRTFHWATRFVRYICLIRHPPDTGTSILDTGSLAKPHRRKE